MRRSLDASYQEEFYRTNKKEFYNKRRSHGTIHATGEARATASSEKNKLFVDKAVPELLLLDCAAEPAPGCCLGQPQNWRLSLLLLLLLLVLLLVQMLLVVRRGSPTRVDARVAGI